VIIIAVALAIFQQFFLIQDAFEYGQIIDYLKHKFCRKITSYLFIFLSIIILSIFTNYNKASAY